MNPQNERQLREMRKQMRIARRNISSRDRSDWNQAIGERVLQHSRFEKSQTVSGYLSFDGEADPHGLMDAAVKTGKRVFVPTIVASDQPLMFVPWSKGCEMASNRFGIQEPVVPKSEWISAKALDFVITPLVAFDVDCHRIGVGGGYYDRSFAHLAQSTRDHNSTCLVGFAFELQKLASFRVQTWDIPLDGVATELSFYRPPSAGKATR